MHCCLTLAVREALPRGLGLTHSFFSLYFLVQIVSSSFSNSQIQRKKKKKRNKKGFVLHEKSRGCGLEPCALSQAVRKGGKCSSLCPARQAQSSPMAASPAGMPPPRPLTTHLLHPHQPTVKTCPFSRLCRSQILFSSRQTRRKPATREREEEQI